MDEKSNLALVDRALGGDASAMGQLFERHYLMVYRLAYKWCGAKDDAEDIAQEVFVKIVRKLHTFRRQSSFKTWLYRVTVNTARDFGRKHGRRESREEAYDDHRGVHNPGRRSGDSFKAAQLRQAIAALPAAQREAVLLVFSEGLSHGEASQVLGCREVTVSWRIFQARKKLRTQLEHRT